MNILQVSSTDLVGKRFNGQYLVENFESFGHTSKHLVWRKDGYNPNTKEMNRFPLGKYLQIGCDKLEEILSVRAVYQPNSSLLKKEKFLLNADVVHYHLMYWPNFFSLKEFPKLTKLKPSVWTIHDFWPITGHCVYPFDCEKWISGCGSCPYLSTNFSMRKDRTAKMWKYKKEIFKKSSFDIVVASNYMKSKVERSPLLNHFPIHHIPFGLDLTKFKPGNSDHSKRLLGISPDEIVITFRAAPGPFKGFEFIKQALRALSNTGKKICLLTFNTKYQLDEFSHKYRIVDLGWVDDENLTLNVYNATDFFLMPSYQETFGMMAIEAMAFGKPVVVCEGTSLPEIVGGNDVGIIIPQGDVATFATIIKKLIVDDEFRNVRGLAALEFARNNYSLDTHIGKLLKVYSATQVRHNNR